MTNNVGMRDAKVNVNLYTHRTISDKVGAGGLGGSNAVRNSLPGGLPGSRSVGPLQPEDLSTHNQSPSPAGMHGMLSGSGHPNNLAGTPGSSEKNGGSSSFDERTPSPAILDPTRPDVIPKSAPMNIPFSAAAALAATSGGTGSPLDLSSHPFSLFMGNPFGMLGGAGGPGNPLLPHLNAAAAGKGGLGMAGDLGLMAPTSLALTGKIFIYA